MNNEGSGGDPEFSLEKTISDIEHIQRTTQPSVDERNSRVQKKEIRHPAVRQIDNTKGDKSKEVADEEKDTTYFYKQEIRMGLEDYEDEKDVYEEIVSNWDDWDLSVLEPGRPYLRNDAIDEAKELGYEPFNPTEALKALRKGTTSEDRVVRDTRTKWYKENLLNQQRVLGNVIEDLCSHIEAHPAVGREELNRLVMAKAPKGRFTMEQLIAIDESLLKFQTKRDLITAHVVHYEGRPADFFRDCFGVEPTGTVVVKKTPFSLHFECENTADYMNAHNWTYLKTEKGIPLDMKIRAMDSGGVALRKVQIPTLEAAVVLEKGLVTSQNAEWRKSLQMHEARHQFNKLFTPVEYQLTHEGVFATLHEQGSTEQVMNALYRRYMKLQRKEIGIDAHARDEILASYMDGSVPSAIWQKMDQSSLYDFFTIFAEEIDKVPQAFLDDFEEYMALMTTDAFDELKTRGIGQHTMSQEELHGKLSDVFKTGYKQDLLHWTTAIWDLQVKKYSKQEILGLLTFCPVSQWDSLVKRLPVKEGSDYINTDKKPEVIPIVPKGPKLTFTPIKRDAA